MVGVTECQMSLDEHVAPFRLVQSRELRCRCFILVEADIKAARIAIQHIYYRPHKCLFSKVHIVSGFRVNTAQLSLYISLWLKLYLMALHAQDENGNPPADGSSIRQRHINLASLKSERMPPHRHGACRSQGKLPSQQRKAWNG